MASPKDSLNAAYHVTASFVESIPKKERKKYGQFFTSRKTAEFMASLFSINYDRDELKLLDAGSGTGLLTAALVERLRNEGYEGNITTVCYENDVKVLPTLSVNLKNLKKSCNIKYEIRTDNYLTTQNFIKADFYKKEAEKFDMIIGNPPYLKIPKDAPILWWSEFLNLGRRCHWRYEVHTEPNDTAVILYSGGTTGTTKGIELTNLNFNASGTEIVGVNQMFRPGDRMH